jgi:hypothetical protein
MGTEAAAAIKGNGKTWENVRGQLEDNGGEMERKEGG